MLTNLSTLNLSLLLKLPTKFRLSNSTLNTQETLHRMRRHMHTIDTDSIQPKSISSYHLQECNVIHFRPLDPLSPHLSKGEVQRESCYMVDISIQRTIFHLNGNPLKLVMILNIHSMEVYHGHFYVPLLKLRSNRGLTNCEWTRPM